MATKTENLTDEAPPVVEVSAGVPAAGVDVANVNEPTKYAADATPREAPVFVRATQDLYAHGVRAAVKGDLVPASVAKENGWDKQTEKI
jgi:hypothetical protein